MQKLMAQVWYKQRPSKALFLGITALFLLCSGSVGWAADDDKPKINPLEITTPDPLLPSPPVERPATPQEIRLLREALDDLNTQATEQLKAGNAPAAFEIWYRELRLRRSLGTVEEVQALGRIGDIAWTNNQKADLQIITQRLQTIRAETLGKPIRKNEKRPLGTADVPATVTDVTPENAELLQALGQAYQLIRLPGEAVEIYQLILADARQRQDAATEQATLKTIAQAHMSWFDYPKAAAAYEELLVVASQKGDRVSEVVYLQQLAYIYDKVKQPENSLKFKQQLLQNYLTDPQAANQIPAIKIAIADDYQALNPPNPDAASQNYQEAYNLAWTLQQFASASEALKKLGDLYRNYKKPEFALQVYQVLLQVDQQSYNYYNLMNTYDQMGQIYLERGDMEQAKTAFQQGLELAKSLKYQENYFVTQIERVSKQD